VRNPRAINEKHAKIIENVIYCTAALSLPNIFLFFLYDNNRVMNDIRFNQVSVLAAILAAISVCLYMLLCRIIRGKEGALLALLIFWIPFWLFESLFSVTSKYIAVLNRIALLIFLIMVIAGAIVYFRLSNPEIFKNKQAFRVLAFVICGLFAFNFIPELYNYAYVTAQVRRTTPFQFKTSFTVDPSLPSPDIYWLHMDGMLGFAAVEKYFGCSQDTLKDELKKRGFVLNEDAAIDAGSTYVAFGMLLSPDFYDRYLEAHLLPIRHLTNSDRMNTLTHQMRMDGLNLHLDITPNLEIINAFKAARYNMAFFADLGHYIFAIDNNYGGTFMSDRLSNDLIQLLTATTPLSITGGRFKRAESVSVPYMERFAETRSILRETHEELMIELLTTAGEARLMIPAIGLGMELINTLSIPSPKLVYMHNLLPHSPYNKLFPPGTPNEVDKMYLAQHEYTAALMLNYVDIILWHNPEAIIILQADHGIHDPVDHDYMAGIGYTDSQIVELTYAVMSAVRMPPQYGGLTAPLDPRDISRLLVNRFVGDNYNMLYYPIETSN